ncbi:glycosyltransferase family 4 protein [Legionella drozanskii]|uniref:Putative glycosyl transferase n=1 Tax=Legionella drozanskii LLAP-1 TaxID=1212489 RepID=A0A0W0SQ26_9GAMM|nr:glycosyltransferase family 1 protein [Legionella drozanskii]KTC85456.1 putative glycosyl transferase [Legionella drozanskii LLAP-1]
MNVIIDVTRLVRRRVKSKMLTGIDRVAIAYIQHYQSSAYALVRWWGRSWILSHEKSKELFTWLAGPSSKSALTRIIAQGILSFSNFKNKENTVLINTGHIGLGQSDYFRMKRKLHVKPIFFIHDLIAIDYPEFCDPGEDLRQRQKMDYILKIAGGVITNSDATLQDLKSYAKLTNQIMPPAKVALLASGIPSGHSGKRPIDKPYFVILSTIEPRKNHILLLQIWRKLSQRLGEKAPHLFVIGYRGWQCENVLDLLDRCHFLKGVVTEVSGCADSELLNFIHHSQALLTPSFIEGYGLPLVEALALGVPVIASDVPVYREIAGNIPEYVDPLDGKRWEELIMDYAQPNSSCRSAQMMRLQHFKKPTWDDHFQNVDDFLSEFVNLNHDSSDWAFAKSQ